MDLSMDMTHYVILCCQLFFEIAKQEIKMSFFFYGDFLMTEKILFYQNLCCRMPVLVFLL